jgi:hypothetical protein
MIDKRLKDTRTKNTHKTNFKVFNGGYILKIKNTFDTYFNNKYKNSYVKYSMKAIDYISIRTKYVGEGSKLFNENNPFLALNQTFAFYEFSTSNDIPTFPYNKDFLVIAVNKDISLNNSIFVSVFEATYKNPENSIQNIGENPIVDIDINVLCGIFFSIDGKEIYSNGINEYLISYKKFKGEYIPSRQLVCNNFDYKNLRAGAYKLGKRASYNKVKKYRQKNKLKV